LSEHHGGGIGIIHFDAHFDNTEEFGDDKFPRCGPIYGLTKIKKVRNESIVHIGIRGPRNSRSQFEFAEKIGATVFDINKVRDRGMPAIVEDAIAIAKKGTDRIYVTICSDCLDVAYNSGGPIDFDGLHPHELFSALFRLGEEGIAGLDYVEVYPLSDPRSVSSHLASWAIIHALSGMASKKRRATKSKPKA
jgi:agmatinase